MLRHARLSLCRSADDARGRCIDRGSLAFVFNDTATTEIYTLSLHDALPISSAAVRNSCDSRSPALRSTSGSPPWRSEEHTSVLQSRSDLVCRLLLEKKKKIKVRLVTKKKKKKVKKKKIKNVNT